MGKIVVTGGLGALGRAVVVTLTRAGHQVAVIDLAPAPSTSDCPVFGGVDLADEPAVEIAYSAVANALGSIDGVVNIAGGFVWETQTDGSIDSWDGMYRMNLRSAAVSSRAALQYLKAGGAIVNVGAASAIHPTQGFAPYAASKAGVMALTESLADELRTRSIRVNAVLPTIIDTPANRADMPDADTSAWVRPEAAADIVAFLLSAQSACVTGVGIRLSLRG